MTTSRERGRPARTMPGTDSPIPSTPLGVEAADGCQAQADRARHRCHLGVHNKVYGPMMAWAFALEKAELMGRDGSTFTVAHENYGTCVVRTTKRIVALKEGYAKGTWDSRGCYRQNNGEHCNKRFRERKAMTIWVPQTKLFAQLLADAATSRREAR